MTRWLASYYDRIIIGLLALQYIFVNLIFTTYTQNIVILKDLSAPLFSLLIFFFWILGDLAKFGRWQLPRHGIVPATVAALLFWLTSVIAGPATSYGVYTWGSTWGYFVQVWALVRFMDSPKKMRFLVHVVIVTNVIMIVYGLSQLMNADILVTLGFIPDWGAATYVSTHGNPMFFAGCLITTMPIFIGYWFVTRNPVLIVGLPILVIVNIYEVIEANCNCNNIPVALVVPLFLIGMAMNFRNLHIKGDSARKKSVQCAAAIIILGIVVGGVAAPDKVSSFGTLVHEQYHELANFNGGYTNTVRLVFFQMALDGALRSPIFGRGIGGFNQQMPETRPAGYHRVGVSHNTDHPHNEFFEWLHDTGVIGLSFFLLILAVYIQYGIRQIYRHRTGQYYLLILASFFGPLNQWIQATYYVSTRWTGNNVTLWFTVGFVLAFVNLPAIRKREELDDSVHDDLPPADEPSILTDPEAPAPTMHAESPVLVPALPSSPYLPIVAIAMTILIGYYIHTAYNFWEADHHLRNNMGFTDGGSGGVKSALYEAEMARYLCYTNMSGYYKLAYTYLVVSDMPKAMNAYRDLQAFAPNYAQIHINLAYLDDQLGDSAASAWERDRAALIEHNTKNHRDAANYWLQLGYPIRALAHLRHCFTIEMDRIESGYIFWNDIDNVHADIARIDASLGRKDEAEIELYQALEINPANVSAAVFMLQLLTDTSAEPKTAQIDALEARLEKYSPNNPAALVIKMTKALKDTDYAAALKYADAAASSLSLPNGQPSQEASLLGNSILASLQTIFAANYDVPKTLDIAGWIYATQARYDEAEKFLQQSFNTTHDPKTGERIGMVKARRGA